MNGIPQELLVIIVGIALFVQFLYEQWRRRVPRSRTPVETAPAPLSETPPQRPKLLEPQPLERIRPDRESPYAPRAGAERGGTEVPPAARVLPRSSRRARRFSRSVLFPDRRAVRNAVVVATILAPCHAHRPHDID